MGRATKIVKKEEPKSNDNNVPTAAVEVEKPSNVSSQPENKLDAALSGQGTPNKTSLKQAQKESIDENTPLLNPTKPDDVSEVNSISGSEANPDEVSDEELDGTDNTLAQTNTNKAFWDSVKQVFKPHINTDFTFDNIKKPWDKVNGVLWEFNKPFEESPIKNGLLSAIIIDIVGTAWRSVLSAGKISVGLAGTVLSTCVAFPIAFIGDLLKIAVYEWVLNKTPEENFAVTRKAANLIKGSAAILANGAIDFVTTFVSIIGFPVIRSIFKIGSNDEKSIFKMADIKGSERKFGKLFNSFKDKLNNHEIAPRILNPEPLTKLVNDVEKIVDIDKNRFKGLGDIIYKTVGKPIQKTVQLVFGVTEAITGALSVIIGSLIIGLTLGAARNSFAGDMVINGAEFALDGVERTVAATLGFATWAAQLIITPITTIAKGWKEPYVIQYSKAFEEGIKKLQETPVEDKEKVKEEIVSKLAYKVTTPKYRRHYENAIEGPEGFLYERKKQSDSKPEITAEKAAERRKSFVERIVNEKSGVSAGVGRSSAIDPS